MDHPALIARPRAAGRSPAREFAGLRGLAGIPDALVRAHLELYEGYVRNLELLRKGIAARRPGTPEWAELQRRVGFEINGRRLHELYFDNLVPGGNPPSSSLRGALAPAWRSVEAWRREFSAMGLIRGVGWVILYRDPVTGGLSNHWIGLHETGHPAGFTPLLVMDLWEHAYTGIGRPAYVEAFLANADWERVELRLRGEG